MRGVLHQVAFPISLVVGALLIVGADGAGGHTAAAVFACSVAACFGVSALYHRVTWTPHVRLWMRRIDHTGVLFLIAGTYTPVCLLVLDGTWRIVVLAIVWAGALAGAALKFAWVEAPNWVAVLVGLTLGWVGVIVLPQLVTRLDPVALALLAVGGLAYTAGAIIYARAPAGPRPVRVRLPRGVPRADARRRRVPVRRRSRSL